jgi:hypothetical protein
MNYFWIAVPTVVSMKVVALWVITWCSSEKSRRFAGNITTIFRAEKLIKQETAEAGGKLNNREDGSEMLLQNVGSSPQYTALQSRRLYC